MRSRRRAGRNGRSPAQRCGADLDQNLESQGDGRPRPCIGGRDAPTGQSRCPSDWTSARYTLGFLDDMNPEEEGGRSVNGLGIYKTA
jgi:hypothetical protein